MLDVVGGSLFFLAASSRMSRCSSGLALASTAAVRLLLVSSLFLSVIDNQRLQCLRPRIELRAACGGLSSGLRAPRIELGARGGLCGGHGATDGIAAGGSGLLVATTNRLRRPHPNPSVNRAVDTIPEVGRAGLAGGLRRGGDEYGGRAGGVGGGGGWGGVGGGGGFYAGGGGGGVGGGLRR
jgi:hypothetical protein